jgi:hypothetical protein
VIIGLLICLIISLLIFNQEYIQNAGFDLDKLGAFGSFIGGIVGSLWALAGIFLIFQALIDQQEVFKLNFKEYQNQINDFKLSKLSFEQQSEVFEIQKFESTFFYLLQYLTEIENNSSIIVNGKNYDKKNYFSFIYKKQNKKFQKEIIEDIKGTTNVDKEFKSYSKLFRNELGQKDIKNIRIAFYLNEYGIDDSVFLFGSGYKTSKYYDDIDNYVNTISQIIKTIYNSKIPVNIRLSYVNTLQSVLSKEQILWYYYSTKFPLKLTGKDNNSEFKLAKKIGLFDVLMPHHFPIVNLYKKLLFDKYYIELDLLNPDVIVLHFDSIKTVSTMIDKIIINSKNGVNFIEPDYESSYYIEINKTISNFEISIITGNIGLKTVTQEITKAFLLEIILKTLWKINLIDNDFDIQNNVISSVNEIDAIDNDKYYDLKYHYLIKTVSNTV